MLSSSVQSGIAALHGVVRFWPDLADVSPLHTRTEINLGIYPLSMHSVVMTSGLTYNLNQLLWELMLTDCDFTHGSEDA